MDGENTRMRLASGVSGESCFWVSVWRLIWHKANDKALGMNDESEPLTKVMCLVSIHSL